jgi:hypothetical protein
MTNTKASGNTGTGTTSNRISMKQSNTFPFRLHEMLATVEREGSEHIVSWIPGNDTAFKVHSPKVFVETVMPRFFQQTKYKSFQRQCNLWGFERLLQGPERGGYEHPNGFFVRGDPGLVCKMERRKIKRRPGEAAAAAASASSESVDGDDVGSQGCCEASQTDLTPAFAVQQRRPSVVSCGSSNNSYSGSLPMAPRLATAASGAAVSAGAVTPTSPLTSYIDSAENLLPTDLCLPPPHGQPFLPQQPNGDAETEETIHATVDNLFLEGLSCFMEEAVAMAPPPSSQSGTDHRRRLSVELFVASRYEQNGGGEVLDLLTGSDELQHSLEMELMFPVASN